MLGWIATVTGIISNLQNMFGRGAPPAPVAPVKIDVFDRVSVVVTPETAAIAIAGTNAPTVLVSYTRGHKTGHGRPKPGS